jgi:hypothetical protein
MNTWFEVDKEGLRKLIATRGKSFIIHELIQNAWDEKVTRVDVKLEFTDQRGICKLVVQDDSPDGFLDISHAYTLYAESKKKDDPTKRGRFNLGEKLVLALSKWARIVSTKAAVEFTEDGKRKAIKERTASGTIFTAAIYMTREEMKEVISNIDMLIPPPGIVTTFNGVEIATREPLAEFSVTLPTIITNAEGELAPSARITAVNVYAPTGSESPTLYEMGIPVCEIDMKYHVDVHQKVPLNQDRDNVNHAYYKTLCTYVLNRTASMLDENDVTANWVQVAIEDDRVEPDSVKAVITAKYGDPDKIVRFDPNDPEAANRAMSHGYKVLYGSQFSGGQWDNLSRAGIAPKASNKFATPKPFSEDGTPAEVIDPKDYSQGMTEVVAFVHEMAKELMGRTITVTIVREMNIGMAAYGDGDFIFSLKGCGRKFFDTWKENFGSVMALVLHEFTHQYESNHLSDNFYKKMQWLFGKAIVLSLRRPELFPDQKVLATV